MHTAKYLYKTVILLQCQNVVTIPDLTEAYLSRVFTTIDRSTKLIIELIRSVSLVQYCKTISFRRILTLRGTSMTITYCGI